MTKYLTLDIETRDDFIKLGLGSGWIYKLKYKTDKYRVLGTAVRTHDGRYLYITRIEALRELISSHDVLIGHNISYDLGGLLTLGLGDVIKDKPIIDTEIMAKLFDSSLMNYKLDFLSKKYLNDTKNNDKLIQAVLDADIYPWLKRELKEKQKCEKKGDTYVREVNPKKVLKWLKSNMEILNEYCFDTLRDYAIQDVKVTYGLFERFQQNTLYEDIIALALYYSFTIHITMSYRITGVRVDLNAARKAIEDIQPHISDMYAQLYTIIGHEVNVKSGPQLAAMFDQLGIVYNKTKKGNPSITKDWLEDQEHEVCKIIVKLRSYTLILDTFIRKIINSQEHTLGIDKHDIDHLDYGMVYPGLHVLRAKTGRFSCTCPNIQQIPKKDKVLGPICRSMFVPFEGEDWYSEDYSNQEGRLHLHYAHLLGCQGTESFVQEFLKNPQFDTHKTVAALCAIERSTAKTIYFGRTYGQGGAGICIALGLETALWTPDPEKEDETVVVAGKEGKLLLKKFNAQIPYLQGLIDKTTESLKRKKYILTIGGRKLKPGVVLKNKKFESLYYRALNSLAQGSAADQIIAAMHLAYALGLKITCVIHDEMNMSSKRLEDAEDLRKCMNDAVTLVIPQYISIGVGKNWATAK